MKFLTVRRCGLVWLLAVCAMAGCSEPREGSRGDELCPSNLEELVALSATELERVDVGRMNLVCADAVSGLGESELSRLLRRLDEWAEDARRAEVAIVRHTSGSRCGMIIRMPSTAPSILR